MGWGGRGRQQSRRGRDEGEEARRGRASESRVSVRGTRARVREAYERSTACVRESARACASVGENARARARTQGRERERARTSRAHQRRRRACARESEREHTCGRERESGGGVSDGQMCVRVLAGSRRAVWGPGRSNRAWCKVWAGATVPCESSCLECIVVFGRFHFFDPAIPLVVSLDHQADRERRV